MICTQVLGLEAPTELVDAANGIVDAAPADVPLFRAYGAAEAARGRMSRLVPSLLGDFDAAEPAPPSLGAACAALGRGRGADGVVAGRGLAVFVDGPAHFARNDERARLGRSVLRNALLEARGLAVVSIREADWEACDDQVALLKARMEEAAVG